MAQFYASSKRQYANFQASIDAMLPPAKSADSTANEGTEPLQIADTSLLHVHFNRAVVLFHLRQPKAALRILVALMPLLDEMDDTLAQRSGLLTIHLLLNTHQVRRAAALIEQLQLRLSTTSPELLPGDDDYDDDVASVAGGGIIGGALMSGLSAAGSGEQHVDVAAASVAAKATETGDRSLERFRWMFRLYKLRCSVLSGRNVIIAHEETSEMSVLRAHQFYNGIDYQMAAKELSKPFENARATIE